MFSGTFETALRMTEDRQANRLAFSLNKPSIFGGFGGHWQVQHIKVC